MLALGRARAACACARPDEARGCLRAQSLFGVLEAKAPLKDVEALLAANPDAAKEKKVRSRAPSPRWRLPIRWCC